METERNRSEIDDLDREIIQKNNDYDPKREELVCKEVEISLLSEEFTILEENFVNEYVLNGGDEKKAAIRAGYSPYSVCAITRKLMHSPKIKAAIEEKRERLRQRYEISQNRVLEEYAKLAFSNLKDMFNEDGTPLNIHEMPDHVAASIQSFEAEQKVVGRGDDKETWNIKKIKSYDKKSTLDSLSKHLGLFEDNSELLLQYGLSNLLKAFPPELQEQIKLSIMRKVEGKLLDK